MSAPLKIVLRLVYLILPILFLAACSGAKEVQPDTYFITGNQYNRCLAILQEALASEELDVMLAGAYGLTDARYQFDVRPRLRAWYAEELDDLELSGVALEMARAGDDEGLVVLQDILLNPGSFAHVEAASAALQLGGLPDTGIIHQAADSSGNDRVRLYAAGVMDWVGEKGYGDRVRRALADPDPIIRNTAIDVLAEIGVAHDTLGIEAAEVPDTFALDRLYKLRTLAILGDQDARQTIRQLLSSPDVVVRSRAAFAIAEAWIPESGGALVRLLEDDELLVRARAAHALILLFYPDSVFGAGEFKLIRKVDWLLGYSVIWDLDKRRIISYNPITQ